MTLINSKHYDSTEYSVVSDKIKKDLCFVPECYEKSHWIDQFSNYHLCFEHLHGDLEYLYMIMKNELADEKYKYNRIKFARHSSLKSIYSVVIEKWLVDHVNAVDDGEKEPRRGDDASKEEFPKVLINQQEIVIKANRDIVFVFHIDDEEEKSFYYPISPLAKFTFCVKKEYVNFKKYTCLHFSNTNENESNENESDYIFLMHKKDLFCYRIQRLNFDNFTKGLFQEVELSPEASEKEIQKTIRKRSIQCHPDKFPNNPEKESEFKRIHHVKELLLDIEKRQSEFEELSGECFNISSKITDKTLIRNYLNNLVQNYNPHLEKILKNNIILYQYLVGKNNHGFLNVMSMLKFRQNKPRTEYGTGFIIDCLSYIESSESEFYSEEEDHDDYDDNPNHNHDDNPNHNYDY